MFVAEDTVELVTDVAALRMFNHNSNEETEQMNSNEDSVTVSSCSDSSMSFPIGELPPNQNDANCIFCNAKFSEDHQREILNECMSYEFWSPGGYTGFRLESTNYFCLECYSDNEFVH
jgi:hypothetical protein